jgi:hypothetical protein
MLQQKGALYADPRKYDKAMQVINQMKNPIKKHDGEVFEDRSF